MSLTYYAETTTRLVVTTVREEVNMPNLSISPETSRVCVNDINVFSILWIQSNHNIHVGKIWSRWI